MPTLEEVKAYLLKIIPEPLADENYDGLSIDLVDLRTAIKGGRDACEFCGMQFKEGQIHVRVDFSTTQESMQMIYCCLDQDACRRRVRSKKVETEERLAMLLAKFKLPS